MTQAPGTRCDRHGLVLDRDRVAACPRCLTETELPPALLDGVFELQEEIGRGGMGSVHRAHDRRLGRLVAIKLLSEELVSQDGFRTRFEREARALAMLSHPGIVAVHGIGSEDGRPFIVMEYVDGVPLSRLMPLAPERAVAIASQVCEALAYAHRQGVVHRDIKPENILIDRQGRAKVADFGIARIVRPDARGWTATKPAEVLGTPQYMAPEVLAGAPPDPRQDVWALGVLLYEMTTGHPPAGDYDDPPPPLGPIVRKALAPQADRRYAGADEMLAALDRVRATASAQELPPDEEVWVRSVAMLQSISTAVAIWAFLLCVQPRDFKAGEMLPLIDVFAERKADGTVHSIARFELWPVIAALATFAIAISCYGLLRRHWRLSGLEHPAPDTRVRESRWVLWTGLVACALWGVRLLVESRGVRIPGLFDILGGLIEVFALFWLWVAILKCWRVSRPLRREPLLWIGFGLALIPPTVTLVHHLRDWE